MAASVSLVPDAIERLAAMLGTKGNDHGGVLSKSYADAVKALVNEVLEADPDPERLPGLDPVRPLEHETSPFVVLRGTPIPKSKAAKKYDCPYCKVKDKFWDGWIVLGEDGMLRLIGDDCKASHVDATVLDAAYSRYFAERSAEFYRQAMPAVVERVGPLFRELGQHLNEARDPAVRICWRVREQLIRDLPELAEHLLPAIRNGKQLTVTVRGRSAFKSERRRDGSDADVVETEQVDRHIIRGGRWLVWPTLPEAELTSAARLLAAAQGTARSVLDGLGGDDQQVTRKARDAVKQMAEAVEKIQSAQMTMRAALAFMEPTHLASLCRWANDQGSPVSHFAYAQLPSGLERDDLERTVRVQLPAGYAPPVFSSQASFEHALERCATLLKR